MSSSFPSLTALDAYAALLHKDRPIVETEKIEQGYKQLLKRIGSSENPRLAFHAALTQKRIGFILKYKSYGIKAASPLGFSLFFLERGAGFSFQRHHDFKTETFHFISVGTKRGFAYLCESDEWDAVYDPIRFFDWLHGRTDAAIERHCYHPKPGDVMRIERTNMVHAAIGCVLEEYANASTDMVDRLHDQNKGMTVPRKFNRRYFQKKLAALRYTTTNRLIVPGRQGFVSKPLRMVVAAGGVGAVTLSKTKDFTAQQLTIPPKKTWTLNTKDSFVSAFLCDGRARCTLLGRGSTSNRLFDLATHEIFLGVPHSTWNIVNQSTAPARLSVLFVPQRTALL